MSFKRVSGCLALLTGATLGLTACGASPAVAHLSPADSPTTHSTTADSPTATTAGACRRTGSGFALSLVSSTGGQTSPQAAARFFAQHGRVSFSVPGSGWVVVSRDLQGATVRSGEVSLHVVEGPDHTWQVDAGTRCG